MPAFASAAGLGGYRSGLRRRSDARPRSRQRYATPKALLGLEDRVGQIWVTTTALLTASAAGLTLEKTKLGGHISANLITMLITLILSNAAVIPMTSPVYDLTNRYLVPLAIPMLLYNADLNRILRTTTKMLVAFVCGAVATVVATLAAWMLIPLGFGAENWKIAAGLCARHIGGALNLVAVSEVTGLDSSILTSVIAADNLAVFFYFMWLFVVGKQVPLSEVQTSTGGDNGGENPEDPRQSSTENLAKAAALSALVCTMSKVIAAALPFPAGIISTSSVIAVALATVAPRLIAPLAPSGQMLGILLLQVFFAASGATGSIVEVFRSAPQLLAWSAVQLAVHFAVLVGLGSLFGVNRGMLYVSSNANVGGPTTAAGMASALEWTDLVVPAILVGILGYATATFLSLAVGGFLLRYAGASGFLLVR